MTTRKEAERLGAARNIREIMGDVRIVYVVDRCRKAGEMSQQGPSFLYDPICILPNGEPRFLRYNVGDLLGLRVSHSPSPEGIWYNGCTAEFVGDISKAIFDDRYLLTLWDL